MNLTQITTQIGSMVPDTDNLPFAQLPKVKAEKGEVPCAVKLVLDLNKNQLYFRFHSSGKTERELFYFGNNKGASAQIFLVRTLKDIRYLFGSVLSDLFLELQKYNMQDCELGRVLKQLQEAGLYVQASKTKEGFLAVDKWRGAKGEQVFFDKDRSNFVVSEQVIDVEKMIREAMELNPREKIVAIVPVVIFPDGSEIVLSEHPDYHMLVRKSLRLEEEEVGEVEPQALRICHLCRQMRPQVASDKYLAKLSRTGLNKIFTTTTVNAARDIKKAGYEDSYAVCQQCYEKLSRGERYITEKRLFALIAGENAFILPEGLQKPFKTYEYFPKVKEAVDFVFKAKDAKKWYEEAVVEAEEQLFTGGYTINLVFYRTDGKSINILDALEDVPPFSLVEIMERFGVWKDRMRDLVKSGMTLGKVYRIIPVRSNRKGEQLNIQRVIDVYKALLLRHLLDPRLLFQYAMEAVDLGFYQKQKDVYRNLRYYPEEQKDFYIRDIIMNYLVLMQVLQEIGVLLKPIFRKDVKSLEQTFQNVNVQESIQRMESFLQEQGFNAEARGLFYLGALLHRVALAQYSKGHKTKPILKKINFQGMKTRDMQRLLADLTEKLMQYRKMTAFTDALMSMHQVYYGPVVAGAAATLDELQNVFFLLAGYSYMVGSKVPDANKEEEQAQQSLMSEDEIEQEDNE